MVSAYSTGHRHHMDSDGNTDYRHQNDFRQNTNSNPHVLQYSPCCIRTTDNNVDTCATEIMGSHKATMEAWAIDIDVDFGH